MSIEEKIDRLTAALEANTAALLGASGGTAKAAPKDKPAADKPKGGGKKKPEHNVDETTAALVKIKDEFGIEHAREILKKHGFAKMAEMTEDKYDAIFADAEAKYAELKGEAGGDGDDDGI